jgi:hypothetical protein
MASRIASGATRGAKSASRQRNVPRRNRTEMTPSHSNPNQAPEEYWVSRIEKTEPEKSVLDRIAKDIHTIKNVAVSYLVLTLIGIALGFIVFAVWH